MATITREDIDALNVSVTMTITKEDYQAEFQNQLKRYRQQAQLKGFRKGKTPMSVVRKMFGRSILSEVVNKQMQEEMSKFLFDEESDLDFLGQPIPADEQEVFEFDPKDLEDFTFKFDLGLAPKFDLQGLDSDQVFERLVVQPGNEQAAEELLNLRRRMGTNMEVEDGKVEGRDIITVTALEMEGVVPKEDGVENEFTLFIENLTDDAKSALMDQEIGAKVMVNPFELEANTGEDHVRKYLLGLEEEDERELNETFQLTIDKISRHQEAELNEEFFEQAFAEGDVSSEEEAIEKIKDDYRGYFEGQSNALLFRDMQEHLMDIHELKFPEAFLKRWLVASNESNTPESVESGFDGFRKGLQWTLIREKLIKHFELEVKQEEVREAFAKQVMGYFQGGNPEWLTDEMVDSMTDRMMQEEKSVREKFDELMNEKISEELRSTFSYKDKDVSVEEFQEVIKEAQAKAEAEARLIDEEE